MKFLRLTFLGLLSISLSIVLSTIFTFYGHFFQVKNAVNEAIGGPGDNYFAWEFIANQNTNWPIYFWIMIIVFFSGFFWLLNKFNIIRTIPTSSNDPE